MSNTTDLKVTFYEGMENDQITHKVEFNRAPTAAEVALFPSINLSRGGTRMYRLDRIADHNGTGANWANRNDGKHSEKQEVAYRTRVRDDFKAAWASFKAALKAQAEAAAAKVAAEAAAKAAKNVPFTAQLVLNGD